MISPGFEMAYDNGVAVELQERAGYFLEERKPHQVVRATGSPPGRTVWMTLLLVSAPVGQDTMHSPQETQEELPMGRFRSKAIPAL